MAKKKPEPLHLTPVYVTDDLAGYHAEDESGQRAFSAESAKDAVEQVARLLGIDFRDVFFVQRGSPATYVIRRKI